MDQDDVDESSLMIIDDRLHLLGSHAGCTLLVVDVQVEVLYSTAQDVDLRLYGDNVIKIDRQTQIPGLSHSSPNCKYRYYGVLYRPTAL